MKKISKKQALKLMSVLGTELKPYSQMYELKLVYSDDYAYILVSNERGFYGSCALADIFRFASLTGNSLNVTFSALYNRIQIDLF